jgi:hypothetical protein
MALLGISPILNAQNFYLHSNGVTCMCPDAAIGETGVVNGVTYTKRTRAQITPQNAATTCTSGVVNNVSNLFSNMPDFNEDISTWDVSNFENMQNFLSGATSFNQDLSHWQFQYWVLMTGFLDNTALSVENYDSFLSNLIGQNIAPTSIGVNGLIYCDETSRNELILMGWNFLGDQPKEIYFEAPEDLNLIIQSTPCSIYNVSLGSPNYSGCEPIIIQNDSPIEFPVGQTVVTWSMIDDNNNEIFDQQVVQIELNTDVALICYITADLINTTNNRIFITENFNNPSLNVDFHEIMSETNSSGIYEIIGYLTPPELSFLDQESNNKIQSNQYKVRTVNLCGVTIEESNFHKTVLLQSNIASNNSVNLIWNGYIGTDINTYFIHRSVNGGPFELISQVAGTSNSYNDTQANVTNNFYEYYLAFEVSDCLTNPFSTIYARSNNEYVNPYLNLADYSRSKNKIIVTPNPTESFINFHYFQEIIPNNITLYNPNGKKIKKLNMDDLRLDLSNFSSGIYFLKFEYNDIVELKTILKK